MDFLDVGGSFVSLLKFRACLPSVVFATVAWVVLGASVYQCILACDDSYGRGQCSGYSGCRVHFQFVSTFAITLRWKWK